MEIVPLGFGLAWWDTSPLFLFLPFRMGMSILCLSHHYVSETYSMFDLTDSQLEKNLPQDESYVEFTYI